MTIPVTDREIASILALFKAEQIPVWDFDRCVKSLSETCLPTQLTQTYKEKIYPFVPH
ncbi:hypothetical protein NVP1022O_90 [Vibrio phage 1.022.O._10N.286.45.A10]|nr:hypothetical protein NVP1022O_90 [Vibrio phage 1.022.O._10N.286.45.A10]